MILTLIEDGPVASWPADLANKFRAAKCDEERKDIILQYLDEQRSRIDRRIGHIKALPADFLADVLMPTASFKGSNVA